MISKGKFPKVKHLWTIIDSVSFVHKFYILKEYMLLSLYNTTKGWIIFKRLIGWILGHLCFFSLFILNFIKAALATSDKKPPQTGWGSNRGHRSVTHGGQGPRDRRWKFITPGNRLSGTKTLISLGSVWIGLWPQTAPGMGAAWWWGVPWDSRDWGDVS